ncbi:MAG: hypothetical protein AAGF10_03580 [Verrucomicrobiota bacterium]
MDLLGGIVLALLVFLFLFFATFFLRLGASVAGVPQHKNTFLRAVAVLFLSWVAIALLGNVGHQLMPGYGTLMSIIAVVLTVFIIRGIFDIGFPKAFITYIFSLIFQVVFTFVALFILGMVGVTMESLQATFSG